MPFLCKIIENVKNIEKHLSELYQLCITNQDSIENFANGLYEYMEYVKKEEILIMVIKKMKEDSARESIERVKWSIDNYMEARFQSMVDDDEEEVRYPIYEYHTLESFERDIRSLNVLKLHYLKLLEDLHKGLISSLHLGYENNGIFAKYFDYDQENGILFFKGKKVLINRKLVSNNSHYLLSYLFKNDPFEKHHYGELEEDRVLLDPKKPKSYYDACVDINLKVKVETGISDFLEFNSGQAMYIRINPEYSISTNS